MAAQYYNLYIESDEEVTTIISRLHIARAKHVALIVPQHSLVLQSIVNLRLLAREAGKQGKEIIIVTQDEEGMVFAKRVGLITVPLQEWQEHTRQTEAQDTVEPAAGEYDEEFDPSQDTSDYIGTGDFFRESYDAEAGVESSKDDRYDGTEALSPETHSAHKNKSQMRGGMDIAPQRTRQRPEPAEEVDYVQAEQQSYAQDHSLPATESFTDSYEENYSRAQAIEVSRVPESVAKMPAESSGVALFGNSQKSQKVTSKKKKKKKKSPELSDSRMKKAHHFGWFLAFLSGVMVFSFLVLPLSFVKVRLGDAALSEKLSLTAKTTFRDVDTERRMIPLRLIEKELTRTVSQEPSGASDGTPQKAYGTLKIYNEFSGSPQSLVATTRFETAEGVVFRLVKATTVPGMKIDGDEVVPGEIEVSVEADKAGPSGNVAKSRWTIPGFASNKSKFAKFYAENTESMAGGSDGSGTQKAVTAEDITAAQKKSSEGLDDYFREQLTGLTRDREQILTKGITHEIIRSEPTVQEGASVEVLEHVTTAKVRALVFDEGDVESVLTSVLEEKGLGSADTSNLQVDYSSVVSDFADGKMTMQANAEISGEAELDERAFIGAIRGKRHDAIRDILKEDYPFVRDLGITTYPPFPETIGNKFSRYGWMTRITVEREEREQ